MRALNGARDGLSAQERGVAAICDLRQEVNSGGFDSYFRYWGGDSAPEALGALRETLGAGWAELLREGMALFGPDYSRDSAVREAVIDDRGLDVRFEELDARFFELEAATDSDRILSQHLAAGAP